MPVSRTRGPVKRPHEGRAMMRGACREQIACGVSTSTMGDDGRRGTNPAQVRPYWIVAWQASTSKATNLVMALLRMALWRRVEPTAHLVRPRRCQLRKVVKT